MRVQTRSALLQKPSLKKSPRGLDKFTKGMLCLITLDNVRITIEVKDLLSPKRAAEYLGVTTMTLWRWSRERKITPVMLDHAYFHINELDRVKVDRINGKATARQP